MIDRNFGGRRVQIVGGYKRLDELSDSSKVFVQSIKRKLFRFTRKSLHTKRSRII